MGLNARKIDTAPSEEEANKVDIPTKEHTLAHIQKLIGGKRFAQTSLARELVSNPQHPFFDFFTDDTIDINSLHMRYIGHILLLLGENPEDAVLESSRKRFSSTSLSNLVNAYKTFGGDFAEVNIQEGVVILATRAGIDPKKANDALLSM